MEPSPSAAAADIDPDRAAAATQASLVLSLLAAPAAQGMSSAADLLAQSNQDLSKLLDQASKTAHDKAIVEKAEAAKTALAKAAAARASAKAESASEAARLSAAATPQAVSAQPGSARIVTGSVPGDGTPAIAGAITVGGLPQTATTSNAA